MKVYPNKKINIEKRKSALKKTYLYSEITEIVKPEDVSLSSFKLKNDLNPYFWHNGKLDLYARKNLLMIAKDLIEGTEFEDMEVEDIIMTGSLANYNWNEKHSDIDLHIVLNFNEIADDTELVKKFFDVFKKSWNQKHEGLKIYGYPVEVYFQDKNEKHTSSGVYSVLFDKWLIEPDRENMSTDNLDDSYIKEKAAEFMSKIDDLRDELDDLLKKGVHDYNLYMDIYDRADAILEEIKETRKESLSADGAKEMTEGNIVFKSLRREKYIEKLFNIKIESYDAANSL